MLLKLEVRPPGAPTAGPGYRGRGRWVTLGDAGLIGISRRYPAGCMALAIRVDTLLADAVDLHIDLNAVIFADGTLIGADDRSALTNLFSAYVQAKQDWYRGIIEALDAGQSVAESFAPVERFLADATNRIRQ